jgi:hypothetical protein
VVSENRLMRRYPLLGGKSDKPVLKDKKMRMEKDYD